MAMAAGPASELLEECEGMTTCRFGFPAGRVAGVPAFALPDGWGAADWPDGAEAGDWLGGVLVVGRLDGVGVSDWVGDVQPVVMHVPPPPLPDCDGPPPYEDGHGPACELGRLGYGSLLRAQVHPLKAHESG